MKLQFQNISHRNMTSEDYDIQIFNLWRHIFLGNMRLPGTFFVPGSSHFERDLQALFQNVCMINYPLEKAILGADQGHQIHVHLKFNQILVQSRLREDF